MKVHSVVFRVELEDTDPDPTGTTAQQAAQIWNAITGRTLSTFRVRKLDYDHTSGTTEMYEVEAVGDEIFGA